MDKKKIRRWIRGHMPMIAAAAAILVLILVLVLALRSCGSKKSAALITAKAMNTGKELQLPLDAELNNGDFVSYGGYQFETNKKLNAMAKLVQKKNDDVIAKSYTNAYGDCWLFTKANDLGGTDSWCLYQKDPANTKSFYIFMGTYRDLTTHDGKQSLLLPLHLISDSYLRDTMGARLEPGKSYACGLSKFEEGQTIGSMFKDFYEQSGLYQLSQTETGFVLVPKGGNLEMTFSFEESGGSSWFTVTIPEIKDPNVTPEATAAWFEDVMLDKLTDPVTLSDADAKTLSDIVTSKNYKSYPAGYEPSVRFILNGDPYEAWFSWTDNTWGGALIHEEKIATLTTKEACILKGMMCAYGVSPIETNEQAVPDDVVITPMSACMVTTDHLNVREGPMALGEALFVMPVDSAVAVMGKTDNDWYEIVFGERVAFLSAQYLKMAE